MRTRRDSLIVLALVAVIVSITGAAPGEDGAPKPADDDAWIFAPPTSAEPILLDPADRRVHVLETRHRGLPTGILVYEVAITGTERLPDGHEYVVRSTWTRSRFGTKRRLVSHEWLRRDASGITCARRQEGAVTADLVPAQLVVPMPLTPGRRWTWEGTAGGLPCRSTSVVIGPERVQASRGTFEGAWRIDTEASGTRGDHLRRSTWYVPGVGLVQERSTLSAARQTLQLDAALLAVQTTR